MRKPEGNRTFTNPRLRWECNIKIDHHILGWVDVDWIDLAQDKDR